MKTGTVKFSKEFITPIGLKEWVGIEYPFDLANSEDPKWALTQARNIVEEWHKSSSQVILDSSIPTSPPHTIQVKPEDREIGVTPEAILSSPDLKVLETYRWLIKGKPELERAYILRYDQLSNSDR